MNSCMILCLQNSELWVKKDENANFEGLIRCYYGVENCELAGIFFLKQVGPIIDKNDLGLYRQDGLGLFCGISKPMIERKKK